VFRQNIKCDQFSTEDDRTNYLSDTFTMVSIIEKFGSCGPIISSYAPGSRDAEMYGGDTVLRHFVRKIMYACNGKNKRNELTPTNDWKLWTAYGQSGQMAYDKPSLLMQALVFHINGRNNQDPKAQRDLIDENGNLLPLFAVCCVTSPDSISRICDALVLPSNRALPLDAATNNQFGALAELDGNILYLNPAKNAKQFDVFDPSVQPAGEQGWNPTPFNISADMARSLWVPWDRLLRTMTAQEQLELCAQEFGADTVNYVIGTDRTLQGLEIPEKIKAAGFGRYANLVGGSVSMTSGVPNTVPAAQANVGAMPRFNATGLGGLGRSPASSTAVGGFSAPTATSMSGVLHDMNVTSTSSPRATGIQNTGTVDAAQVMRNVAAIRAAAGMGQHTMNKDAQADAASSLIGSLPSEEDQ
jgi:hypothetical protein